MSVLKREAILPTNDHYGLIDNLHLQIAVLRAENDDLATERNLYKSLFENNILIKAGPSGQKTKKINPAFKRWLAYKGNKP